MVCNKGFAQFPFPGPTRPELVALMHLSSGRREDELQDLLPWVRWCLAQWEKRARSSDLKNMSSAPSHHCIFIVLFSLMLPLQLVIDHFCSGRSSV